MRRPPTEAALFCKIRCAASEALTCGRTLSRPGWRFMRNTHGLPRPCFSRRRFFSSFISYFGCEHIELRRQAHEASRNVTHDKGAVVGDTRLSCTVLEFLCKDSASRGVQHGPLPCRPRITPTIDDRHRQLLCLRECIIPPDATVL